MCWPQLLWSLKLLWTRMDIDVAKLHTICSVTSFIKPSKKKKLWVLQWLNAQGELLRKMNGKIGPKMQSLFAISKMHKNPTTALCQQPTANNNIKWKIHHIKSFARHWHTMLRQVYTTTHTYNVTAATTTTISTTKMNTHTQREKDSERVLVFVYGTYEARRSVQDTLAISCTDTINLRPFISFLGYALSPSSV